MHSRRFAPFARHLLVFLAGAGGAALVPVSTAASAPAARPAPAFAADATQPLRAELSFTGVRDGAPELALDVASRLGDGARALYHVEVRDDHGKLVLAKQQPPAFALGASAHFDLALGALPDGFYRTTATLVARGAEGRASAAPEAYFEARGGEITPLEPDDFFRRSAYNQGVER